MHNLLMMTTDFSLSVLLFFLLYFLHWSRIKVYIIIIIITENYANGE